jgi:hypothetical protein
MTWILTAPKTRVQEFVDSTENGKIFSATFEKKDGTIRTINCRRAVKKGVKGVGMSFDPMSKGLLVVYDMHHKGFRMINLDKLIEAKVNGKTIKFL